MVLVLANAIGYVRFLQFRTDLKEALAPSPSGRLVDVTWTFPFENSRFAVELKLDEAEIAAADRLDMSRVFGSRGWLRKRYLAEVVRQQSESATIDRLVHDLRHIRDERHLDSDEYLELVAAAVQSTPYGEVGGPALLAPQVLAIAVSAPTRACSSAA